MKRERKKWGLKKKKKESVHILIVVMNCQPLHSFSTSITSDRKMIEYPRAAWVFNKLLQRRMSGKEDEGEAMSFDYFSSLRSLISVFYL